MQQTMQTEDSREKDRQLVAGLREIRLLKFRTCCLTNVALEAGTSVVCDEIGNLFAKEGLLAAMVEKTLPPEYSHIRGLKDVVNLVFHANSDAAGTDVDWSTDNWSPYSCPIASVEMNGRQPFVALRRSAPKESAACAMDEATRVNVISDKAYREVGFDALQAEYGPFAVDGVIPLVPTDLERIALVEAMSGRRELEQSLKADAKAKRKSEKRSKGSGSGAQGAVSVGESGTVADVTAHKKRSKKNKSSAAESAPSAPPSSHSSAHFLGSVMSEAAKSLADAKQGQSGYAALFHGAGSQKPLGSTEMFIVQAGKRGVLD